MLNKITPSWFLHKSPTIFQHGPFLWFIFTSFFFFFNCSVNTANSFTTSECRLWSARLSQVSALHGDTFVTLLFRVFIKMNRGASFRWKHWTIVEHSVRQTNPPWVLNRFKLKSERVPWTAAQCGRDTMWTSLSLSLSRCRTRTQRTRLVWKSITLSALNLRNGY